MAGTRRKRKSSARSPSVSAGRSSWVDATLLTGLTLFALGTAFLLGGTVFWTAAPMLVPGLLLVLVSQGLALFSDKTQRLVLPPGGFLWLFLLIYILIRAVFVPRIPYQAWAEFLYAGSVFVIYVTLTDLCIRRSAYRWVILFFFLAVILQSMYALSLHYHGLRDVLWLERPEGYEMRASGTFICPNHFAQLLQMGIVLAVACLLWSGLGVPIKLVAGYTLAVSVPAILLSGSRAGWLGTFVGVGVVLLGAALRTGFKKTILIFSGLIPLGVGSLWAVYRFMPMVQERVDHARRGDVRFAALWPDTLRLIEGEGFWGAGPGMYRHVFEQYRYHFNMPRLYLRHAHNEFLHLIADYGWAVFTVMVLGLLGITWMLLAACWRERSRRQMMIPLTLLALFVAKTVHSVFDFNVHVLGNMTPFVLLAGALYGLGLYEGLWAVRATGVKWTKPILGMSMLFTTALLAGMVVFGVSSWAEYRMDQARRSGGIDAEKRYAAVMRAWTPFHWRGWREYGFQLRSEAFLIQDPALRLPLSEQAHDAYEMALKWNPYDRISMLGLAQLDIREGKHVEALAVLEKLILLDPMDHHVHTQYALTLRRLGRYAEALEAFRTAGRLSPGQRQIQANIHWLTVQLREQNQKN